MSARQNKNDYSVVIFLQNGRIMKMQYVHNIYSLVQFLNKNFIEYKYINIYLRRTGEYLKRQYPNTFVQQKP